MRVVHVREQKNKTRAIRKINKTFFLLDTFLDHHKWHFCNEIPTSFNTKFHHEIHLRIAFNEADSAKEKFMNTFLTTYSLSRYISVIF